MDFLVLGDVDMTVHLALKASNFAVNQNSDLCPIGGQENEKIGRH